ncbi:Starch synthase [Zostera marina]|uniref:Starch synthase, chloroplastic/amyloplastic n=1 Tax=Zostera marina TaxID=29655 RepID=A0A0K9Q0C0_ZOSMR|nr:Starch synthase [Zostera marina]
MSLFNYQLRRLQLKNDSQEKPLLKPKIQHNDEEDTIDQNAIPDCIFYSHNQTIANEDSNGINNVSETNEVKNVNDKNQSSRIELDDLFHTINNPEKIHDNALKELKMILVEKEMLQQKVNALEMKLVEDDAQTNVVHKNEIHTIETDDHENHRIRNENMVLKSDIKMLKDKLRNVQAIDERVFSLENERSKLLASVKELEFMLSVAQKDVSKLSILKTECEDLHYKIECLHALLDTATKHADQADRILKRNDELERKVEKLEALLKASNPDRFISDENKECKEILLQRVKILENQIQMSDEKINANVPIYQGSVKELQDIVSKHKEESMGKLSNGSLDDMPQELWNHVLSMVDSWLLEKKISSNDAILLREMAWKRDDRIKDAYFICNGEIQQKVIDTFLKIISSQSSSGLNIVHIAAEMAPVVKVGGLGDVVTGLCKALQRRGHLVEVILPKYDCMQIGEIDNLQILDVVIESYFDGHLFKNKIWFGTIEGLPVYFIEPLHPAQFFLRGNVYGVHDDFKRFSYFSRAALEFICQFGKKPDIIHCHDWQTAFIPPLYWELYAVVGFNFAKICFTCHNFEYQGTAHASELASCGLGIRRLHRADRMMDNLNHDRINLVKGAIVFSNIVTTVSPTYADEVRTAQGGHGLHDTLNLHSLKFTGIVNGIDTETWNPFTDPFLRFHYNADDLHGKDDNKDAIRKYINLSTKNPSQPLVACITRLVPQKGVHLIRHAIYRTLELGGQFILLGSSPIIHIQREFEDIANQFQNHPNIRLVLKYDNALSHFIYAASDMFVMPSIFEPCGLTQMIAMRYGSVPIVRNTGGLNDSVFDVDDDAIPAQLKNGFTFSKADELGLNNALERAFHLYTSNKDGWLQLVKKNMRTDFSWNSSSVQYEKLYLQTVARTTNSEFR